MTIWADDVQRFWYGDGDVHADDYEHLFARWYRGGPDFDREVRDRYLGDLERAQTDHAEGALDRWGVTPLDRHALVLLFDQFPRNMFRGSARMFATDPIARALVHQALADGAYGELAPVQRLFMAVALEHSEDRAEVELSALLIAELCEVAPRPQRGRFEAMKRYNGDHLRVVQQFGRYPHRNALLGRTTTAEEESLLARPKKWMQSVLPTTIVEPGGS